MWGRHEGRHKGRGMRGGMRDRGYTSMLVVCVFMNAPNWMELWSSILHFLSVSLTR